MPIISERQSHVLQAVIQEYIRTAEPVGSERLAEIFGVSSATIRNDLAALEEMRLLTHPHTSAGRTPTEKGYQFYIHHFVREKTDWQPAADVERELRSVRRDAEVLAKELAKLVAAETHAVALASIDARHVFYTGLSNLFSQPEFQEPAHIIRVSEILDQVDEVVRALSGEASRTVRVYLGQENPFGANCGSIVIKVSRARQFDLLLGLVGPMRMDYDRNIAIMRGAAELYRSFAR